MKALKLQQQPTGDTCVSACLAMILDLPVQQVIDEFHRDYCDDKITSAEYLQSKGVKVKIHPAITRKRSFKGLHLITVPSLNIEGALHQIIWDRRVGEDGPIIFDPNEGKPGKRYYVNKWPEDMQEGEVNVSGRIFDLEVL